MAIATRFTERFGLTHPIVSAPMANAAGGRLAAAVSAAGGLGLIGGSYGGNEDWLEEQFRVAGNQAVGCGFITWALARQPQLLDAVLAHRPSALMLSFGDPARFAPTIHAAGVPLICQVQTLAHARAALDAGAAAIVAQGTEAGGHGASRATLTLVPEVADLCAVRAPDTLVLAAGGIADGRGLAAALMLGADGVLIGSRLWATEEALVHPNLHRAALAADGDATLRTTVIDIARKLDWPAEFTIRMLRNDFTDRWHGDEASLSAAAEAEAERYQAASEAADTRTAGVVIGEAAGLMHDIAPAADIVARIAAQAETLLRNGAGQVDAPM